MNRKKRLVIIGGGFAGLNLAKNLDKKKWEIIIVDKNNYHSFPPLFYQVASSGLEPASIAFPLRKEMVSRKMKGVSYRYGAVSSIDVAASVVTTQFETISYDSLVIAAGTTNNFFGMDSLPARVYTLKSMSEAIRCRNVILDRLERAALCTDPEKRKALLTFTVVGGGPAGVEIAGAIGEVKKYVIRREYPTIDVNDVHVILVEGTDKVLRTMSERSSSDALKSLEKMLVEVRLGKTMKDYSDGVISFSDGESYRCETVIWTAGVTGVGFEIRGAEVKYAPGGRFAVDGFNRLEGIDNVYAIGDISSCQDEEYPRGCPQVAQVAIQQGRCLARNLNAGSPSVPFRYKDKGSMATIGRNMAVVDIGRKHLSGWLAWMAWMFIHLISLLGMRNKTVVLINWMWSYFTFSSGLRLILRPSRLPIAYDYHEKR